MAQQEAKHHLPYREIGNRLASVFGVRTAQSLDEWIARQDEHGDVKALLSASVSAIWKLTLEVRALRSDIQLSAPSKPTKPPNISRAVADGMLHVLKGSVPVRDCPIDYYSSEMTGLMRRACRKAGITRVSEINEESLLNVKGCGIVTRHRLLELKRRKLGAD